MADVSTTPAAGDVLPGAAIIAADPPTGTVVALRVNGATYPWQRRERLADGRWLPPVNPKAEYEVVTVPEARPGASS